jgi:hypothetical protein
MARSLFSCFCALFLVLMMSDTRLLAKEEGGAGGITMKLVDASGNAVSSCITKDDGTWSLSAPKAGDYSIVVIEEELSNARTAIVERVQASLQQTATSEAATITNTSSALDAGKPKTITFSWTMKDDASVSCVVSPRDPVSGLPSGKSRRTAVMFVREFDKMVPTITTTKPTSISGNLSYTVKPIRKQ